MGIKNWKEKKLNVSKWIRREWENKNREVIFIQSGIRMKGKNLMYWYSNKEAKTFKTEEEAFEFAKDYMKRH